MATTARLVDEITGNVIMLERDESDPLWCVGPVITGVIDYGFASPRVVQTNNPDANGTTDLTEFHADKTVSWNGWIVPTSDQPFPALVWDQIRRLCAPNRRPWMFVQEDGWPAERRMTLRHDSLTAPLDRQHGPVIIAAITWKCPSGVMESSVANQQNILPGGETGGYCVTKTTGYCFVKGSCFSFGAGIFGGSSNVNNSGTVVAYPLISFIGPATNPRVINTQTLQGIYLNATLIPNQQIVVDTLHKTVYEVANPNINRLGWFDFTKSTWLTLQPGLNPFSYYSDNGQGTCRFAWRDRWS